MYYIDSCLTKFWRSPNFTERMSLSYDIHETSFNIGIIQRFNSVDSVSMGILFRIKNEKKKNWFLRKTMRTIILFQINFRKNAMIAGSFLYFYFFPSHFIKLGCDTAMSIVQYTVYRYFCWHDFGWSPKNLLFSFRFYYKNNSLCYHWMKL